MTQNDDSIWKSKTNTIKWVGRILLQCNKNVNEWYECLLGYPILGCRAQLDLINMTVSCHVLKSKQKKVWPSKMQINLHLISFHLDSKMGVLFLETFLVNYRLLIIFASHNRIKIEMVLYLHHVITLLFKFLIISYHLRNFFIQMYKAWNLFC